MASQSWAAQMVKLFPLAHEYFCGLRSDWSLQSSKQPTFVFVDHVCTGKVGPVLMMELVSLLLH